MLNKRDINPHARQTTLKRKKTPKSFEIKVSTTTKLIISLKVMQSPVKIVLKQEIL